MSSFKPNHASSMHRLDSKAMPINLPGMPPIIASCQDGYIEAEIRTTEAGDGSVDLLKAHLGRMGYQVEDVLQLRGNDSGVSLYPVLAISKQNKEVTLDGLAKDLESMVVPDEFVDKLRLNPHSPSQQQGSDHQP